MCSTRSLCCVEVFGKIQVVYLSTESSQAAPFGVPQKRIGGCLVL